MYEETACKHVRGVNERVHYGFTEEREATLRFRGPLQETKDERGAVSAALTRSRFPSV